ncbi:MAG TPA: 30S ribosome-binding factor RbfA [Nitrospiraceae bacterium]|nr:30S ribosome-binding factor RbfA [Nitrospiraceae bacterium]
MMLVTGQTRTAEQLKMSKSTYKRADRVADQIRMEVADILMRKIKDPRVRSVTVTDVELTADLRIAHIFVTTMEKEQAERDVFAGLSKASGFVRAELGRRLTLRYLPEIIFKKDVSGPRGDRVLQLLDELHVDAEQAGAPAPAPPPDTTTSGL